VKKTRQIKKLCPRHLAPQNAIAGGAGLGNNIDGGVT
jgi:hypothetical protein